MGVISGFPILDPIASIVVICIFIGKASYGIFKDAIDKMVDKSCDPETITAMEQLIMKQNGVERIDMLQTRLFGAKIYVDADGKLTLAEGHDIAQEVHDAIEREIPLVKHCMVHVNPA